MSSFMTAHNTLGLVWSVSEPGALGGESARDAIVGANEENSRKGLLTEVSAGLWE